MYSRYESKMKLKSYIILWLTFLHLVYVEFVHSQKDYVAGVVQFSSKNQGSHPGEVVLENAHEYFSLIQKAHEKGVNILVFPEYGLTTYEVNYRTKINLDNYAVDLPNTNDLSTEEVDEVLNRLSKEIEKTTDKNKSFYVIVNVIEKIVPNLDNTDDYPDYETYKFYSTSVVFDRYGNITKSYQKINKDKQNKEFENGEKVVTFKTDFGIEFGLLINEDLLFSKPALELIENNITNFIYSACWASKPPFLTALSVQAGFAKMYGVNLLSSNNKLNAPFYGGSGIFTKSGGANLYLSNNNDNKLLKKSVDQNSHPSVDEHENPIHENIFADATREDFKSYNVIKIQSEGNETICVNNEQGCCTITYKFNEQSAVTITNQSTKYTYMIAAYIGKHTFGEKEEDYATCGIVACANQAKESCGSYYNSGNSSGITFEHITIKLRIVPKGDEVYFPSTLSESFYPLKSSTYNVSKNGNEIEMKTTESISNVLTFAFVIKGSIFDKNYIKSVSKFNGNEPKSSSPQIFPSPCILSSISILVCFLY